MFIMPPCFVKHAANLHDVWVMFDITDISECPAQAQNIPYDMSSSQKPQEDARSIPFLQ